MPLDDDKIVLLELGRLLSNARKAKGLSQRDLADLTNMDPGHIGKIELGQKDIQYTTIVKILVALKDEANVLFPDTSA